MKQKLFSLIIAAILALSLFWALPPQTALAATCTWNGSTSTDWGVGANWSGCSGPPTATDNVVIPTGLSLYPIITADQLIVNVQIDSGGSLSVTGGSLDISGNLTCDGAYTATGRPTLFTGTGNQTVSGSGTTTFGSITINNTGLVNNNIVEFMPSAFIADAGFLTLSQGIIKLSGSFWLSNSLFSLNNYLIEADSGVWINNPNVTVIAAPGSSPQSRLSGLLRITAGTYNVGDAYDESLMYFGSSASLTLEGGALIVAGRFSQYDGTSMVAFVMSGGTFTVGTLGHSSASRSTFDVTGTTSSVALSGGTIVIQNENSGGPDFRMTPAGPFTITGGTVQFANSATLGAAPSFVIGGPVLPSFTIVDSTAGSPVVQIAASLNIGVYGNISIGADTTLDANNRNITVNSNPSAVGTWTNNGIFTPGTGLVTFSGAAGQTIGGTSATTFNNLVIANTAAGGVSLASSPTVNGNLVVNALATLNAATYDITVAGTITNNGMLRQTKDVNDSSDVSFFATGSYGGVILNANSTPLGTTNVAIWGNHDCTTIPNETVKRCFYIDPANTTGLNATITFNYVDSELVAGSTCDTLNAYHNSGGGAWGTTLTLDTSYGGDGRVCESIPRSLRVIGVSTFSPFALRTGTPTVVQLSNLSAHNYGGMPVALLAFALGLLVMGAGLIYLRIRKV